MTSFKAVLIWAILTVVSSGEIVDTRPYEDVKNIMVYIDPKPPSGYTTQEWHNMVMSAMAIWFSPAGYSVTAIDDVTKAEMRFVVKEIRPIPGQPLRYGQTFSSPVDIFPCIPYVSDNVRIEINAVALRNRDVFRTLLHEIGHAIGLKHRSGSIMSVGTPRSTTLTDRDRESIQSLKKYLEEVKEGQK